MMPPYSKLILFCSVLLNCALLGMLLRRQVAPEREPAPAGLREVSAESVPAPETFSPIVKPAFHWSQVESTNYFEYVAGLRAIGCPEQTIRDIVSADLNTVLADPDRGAIPTTSPGRLSWQEQQKRLVNYILSAGAIDTSYLSGPSRYSPTSPRPALTTMIPVAGDGATGLQRELAPSREQAPSAAGNLELPQIADGLEPVPNTIESQGERSYPGWTNKGFWLADLIRARYGMDALGAWQQQAVHDGLSLGEFVQQHEILVPPLPIAQ